MKTYGGVEVQLNAFLTLAIIEWLASLFGLFTPDERAPRRYLLDWTLDGPQNGLDAVA
jgi:hypothetical protein